MRDRSAVLNPPEPDGLDCRLVRHDVGGRTVHSFETGRTRWLLDLPTRRYLAVPSDTPLDFRLLLAPWRPFHSVLAAGDTLTIVLDGDQRRLVHVRTT
jgi:hypothetical protein